MSDSPGWDALDGALKNLYPDQEPVHFGTVIKYDLGGPDPLDGISIYDHDDHWHYVTFGYSELYAKESELPHQSGWGFEMTFRLRKHGESEAPHWVASLLQNLARYVFERGNTFKSGDHMDLNGPVSLDEETQITAVAFMPDPELPEVLDTPNGKVRFVMMVGITADELKACKSWNTLGALGLVTERYPLGVTDLKRSSVLEDPLALAALTDGKAASGSNTGMLFVEQTHFTCVPDTLALSLGALAIPDICDLLLGRIPFGRELTLASHGQDIVFKPGEKPSWKEDPAALELTLDVASAQALAAALQPMEGRYCVPEVPGLEVEVVRTAIRDRQGKLVRMVGAVD